MTSPAAAKAAKAARSQLQQRMEMCSGMAAAFHPLPASCQKTSTTYTTASGCPARSQALQVLMPHRAMHRQHQIMEHHSRASMITLQRRLRSKHAPPAGCCTTSSPPSYNAPHHAPPQDSNTTPAVQQAQTLTLQHHQNHIHHQHQHPSRLPSLSSSRARRGALCPTACVTTRSAS
jgi:hypothetical protein